MPVIIDGTLGVNAAAITTTNWTPTNITTGGNTTLGDASNDTLTINSTIQPGIVISGASSTNALRITQTGSGNALVVEDADNPDSTPFVIDSEGRVAIGTPAAAYAKLSVQGAAVASDTASPITIYAAETFGPSTTSAFGVRVNPSTASNSGTPYTINLMRYFYANQGTFSADSTVTAQAGFHASGTLTGAGTNYGFYSDIASGTNRYNFYSNGTAPNYFAGKLFLNAGVSAAYAFQNNLSITGATTAAGNYFSGQVQSDVVDAYGLRTDLRVASSAFTLNTLTHYAASQDTIGANATVTYQHGFLARGTLIGATNNYGFRSDITAATGRWNFYASGDANNYFAGNVGVGTNAPFSKLTVYGPTGIVDPSTGEATGVGTIRIENGSGLLSTDGGLEFKVAGDTNGYGAKIQALNSGGAQLVFANRNASATWVERMRITSDGKAMIGMNNGQSTFNVYNANGGAPATSGSTDTTTVASLINGVVGLDFGHYVNGTAWVQNRTFNNYATNYDLTLQPNGGNVGIGTSAQSAKLSVFGSAGRYSELLGNTVQVRLAASEGGWNSLIGFANNAGTFLGGILGNGSGQAITDIRLGVGSTPGAVVIDTNGTVTLSQGQLRFPATQNASSDPNTLDDYEEGTWTPAWNTTNSNLTAAYGTQSGRYTKIGRMVYLTGYILVGNITSQGTGSVIITGAPFPVTEEVSFTVSDGNTMKNYLSSTATFLTAYGQNTNQIKLGTMGSAGNSYGVTTGSIQANTYFLFNAWYTTNT